MPNDFFTYKFLANELKSELLNSRIVKVLQTDSNVFCFKCRKDSINKSLLLSLNKHFPICHIAKEEVKAELKSGFSSKLKKMLINSIIIDVKLYNNDRIFEIITLKNDELHTNCIYKLYLEAFTNNPNLIITNERNSILLIQNRIIDSEKRQLYEGEEYIHPENKKINIYQYINQIIENKDFDTYETISDFINNIGGLSKASYLEIWDTINNKDINRLEEIKQLNLASFYKPNIVIKDSKLIDFFAFEYKTINYDSDTENCIYYSNLSEIIEHYNKNAFQINQSSSINHNLTKLLNYAEKKLYKKLGKFTEVANNSEKLDILLNNAELFKNNIYKHTPGISSISCYNYHTNTEQIIELDPLLSAEENLRLKFKYYKKFKGALAHANKQIEEINNDLDYINTVRWSINNKLDSKEIDLLFSEICNKKIKLKKPSIKNKMYSFDNNGPYILYYGNSSIQNDYITFKLGKKNDLWLHTKNSPGPHAVLKGPSPFPEHIIVWAAKIIAINSSEKHSSKVEVAYTLIKNIKKLGKPGLVSYSKYSSIVIDINK